MSLNGLGRLVRTTQPLARPRYDLAFKEETDHDYFSQAPLSCSADDVVSTLRERGIDLDDFRVTLEARRRSDGKRIPIVRQPSPGIR